MISVVTELYHLLTTSKPSDIIAMHIVAPLKLWIQLRLEAIRLRFGRHSIAIRFRFELYTTLQRRSFD